MPIQHPAQIVQTAKRVRMLIAGHPGIGKSTLALSAPKPLHIDVDRGVDRVSARHRHPFIQPKSYTELMDDLKPNNLTDFETIVIDTGGQLFKFLADHAKSTDTKNGKRDGSLSLPGYGAVGRLFEDFTNHVYYNLNKHMVLVFHAKEEKDGDITRLRLLVEGSTKDNVWQPMDIGGYVEMEGNNRVLRLQNCERHFGKCCYGIPNAFTIPDLSAGAPNLLLTDLFAQINANIAAEAAETEVQRQAYEEVMAQVRDVLSQVIDGDSATAAAGQLKDIKHVLTSAAEARNMLLERTKTLNLRWSKEAGTYVSADPLAS